MSLHRSSRSPRTPVNPYPVRALQDTPELTPAVSETDSQEVVAMSCPVGGCTVDCDSRREVDGNQNFLFRCVSPRLLPYDPANHCSAQRMALLVSATRAGVAGLCTPQSPSLRHRAAPTHAPKHNPGARSCLLSRAASRRPAARASVPTLLSPQPLALPALGRSPWCPRNPRLRTAVQVIMFAPNSYSQLLAATRPSPATALLTLPDLNPFVLQARAPQASVFSLLGNMRLTLLQTPLPGYLISPTIASRLSLCGASRSSLRIR